MTRTHFLPTLSTLALALASAVLIVHGDWTQPSTDGHPRPQRDLRSAPFVAAATCSKEQTMKRFLIERDIPGVGRLDGRQLKDASATSNAAPARLSGFPASKVTDVRTVIEPMTAA